MKRSKRYNDLMNRCWIWAHYREQRLQRAIAKNKIKKSLTYITTEEVEANRSSAYDYLFN